MIQPPPQRRKNLRLPNYDYAQPGAYFLTIVTQGRACLFGKITNGEMQQNPAGEMVVSWWQKLACKYNFVDVEQYVLMPNHFHGILIIHEPEANLLSRESVITDPNIKGQTRGSAPTQNCESSPALSTMVQWFKTMTTNAYIKGVEEQGWPRFNKRLWQRSYYEHIVRDESELIQFAAYIQANPTRWEEDSLFLDLG